MQITLQNISAIYEEPEFSENLQKYHIISFFMCSDVALA